MTGGPHPMFHVAPVIVTTKQYNTTLTEDEPSLIMVYTIFHTVKKGLLTISICPTLWSFLATTRHLAGHMSFLLESLL